jgi:2-octaprenyl-6-methoxyphenol hydroxylase
MVAALALCQRGLKLALIDRLDYNNVLAAPYDGRTFAYAYGSKLILEKLGVWQGIEDVAVPITDIFVTAEGPGQGLHYSTPEGGTHPMGYNIETRHFRKVVYERLLAHDHFTLLAPVEMDHIAFTNPLATVTLKNQTLLQAPLIIAADGKDSAIRAAVGIKSRTIPYHQKAIVCVIEHTLPHHNCAYEHFLTSGPLAILPMEGNRSGVIWSLSDTVVDSYYPLSDADLAQELEKHFGTVIGSLKLVGQRWLFPLDMTLVKNYVAPRLVLIGDAAHAIHPVAGQGFNLGLRDIDHLAQTLTETKELGLDLGSLTILKAYEHKRRLDVLSMTGMCDGLVRLFSNDNRSLGHLRRMGLDLTNSLPALKRRLTQHAMGL